jgi:hypothetical protein
VASHADLNAAKRAPVPWRRAAAWVATGPVVAPNIQRVADVMLEFGVLKNQYRAEVENGALIRSMIG